MHTLKQTGLLFLLAINTLFAKSLGPSWKNCIFGNMVDSKLFPDITKGYGIVRDIPGSKTTGEVGSEMLWTMFGISSREFWYIADSSNSYKRHHAVGRVLRIAFKYLFGRGDTQHA